MKEPKRKLSMGALELHAKALAEEKANNEAIKRNIDSYRVQLQGPILAHGSLRGYYLIWPGGFESAMPDRATALTCAHAGALLAELKAFVARYPNNVGAGRAAILIDKIEGEPGETSS